MTDTFAAENPRLAPGNNMPPDWAKIVTDAMAEQYAPLAKLTTDKLAAARTLPATVENPADSEKVATAVADLLNMFDEAEAARVKEKREYLEKERAVDGYFGAIKDRLKKAADILHARVHNYNERRRIAEEKRRADELAEANRKAAAAAKAEREAREAAEEAARKAARARKPENIEAHKEAVEQHTEQAESARVETLMAAAAVDEANIATMQKPGAMVGETFDSGLKNTMRQVGYAELVDRDLLDLNALRPYFREADLLAALKAYAKATGHKKPLAGANIGFKADTVIRR